MNNGTEIVQTGPESVQLQKYNGENPIGAMLNAVVEKGVTAENVAAMKELVGLYERMEDRGAKQAFTAAMTAMQAEMPSVIAKSVVKNNDGTARYSFANYETIMGTIEPVLTRHGFSVSFSIRSEETRLCAVCKITHAGGHSETNEFAVRIGKGPPGCSEAQADGAARSYARRGALCDALNIVVDRDDDARNLGAVITPEQSKNLAERVRACGIDEQKLLNYAAAENFDSIRATKYAAVDAEIRKREQAKTTKAPKPGASKGDANAQPPAEYDLSGNIKS